MTLGEFVRTGREKKGPLRHVAEHLKVSAGSLSRLENDHPIPFSAQTLGRIFDHLGLDRWEGFRLADITDPDLPAMMRQPARALVEMIRLFHGAKDEEWTAALDAMKKTREKESDVP